MNTKQFNILIGAIILAAIILGVGFALQGGVYRCEKIEWEDNTPKSDLYWYRLNIFTGYLILSKWNREAKEFIKLVPAKQEP